MHSEHGFFAKLVYQIKQRQQNRTNPERLRVNVIIKDAVSLETARDIIQRFSIAIEAYEKLQMELNDYLEQKKYNKAYSFIEYSKLWGYKSSEVHDLNNPFAIKDDGFTELKNMRKYVMQRGMYPHSGRVHTKRWKFYRRNLLQKLPFEQYMDISLEELADRSQQSFNKKSKFRPIGWETYMASKLRRLPDRSCFGIDRNGKSLYVVIKNGISTEEQNQVLSALMNILIQFPEQRPNKRDARHKNNHDVFVYHLIDWCPKGHPDQPCVSKQTLANGRVLAVDSIIQLTQALKRTRIELSAMLEAINPEIYQQMRDDVTYGSTLAYQRLLQTCQEDTYLGEVFNTGCIANHRDWNDIKAGLSGMSCFGHFVGGDLCLPDLGIKIPYQPGTLILLSTQALEHFIGNFSGVRFGMVHCSHMARHKKNIERGLDARWVN